MNTTFTVNYKMQSDADQVEMTEHCQDMEQLLRAKRNIVRRKGFVEGSLNVTENEVAGDEYLYQMTETEQELQAGIEQQMAEVTPIVADQQPESTEEAQPETDEWLPAMAVARDIIGCQPQQVFQRIAKGKLQAKDIDGKRHVLKSEILSWCAERAARKAK